MELVHQFNGKRMEFLSSMALVVRRAGVSRWTRGLDISLELFSFPQVDQPVPKLIRQNFRASRRIS